MTDYDLPDLPSDEELGIDGLDEEELLGSDPPQEPPPPEPGPRATSSDEDPPGRHPGSWNGGLITLSVLLVGAWAMSENRSLPATVPANAPDSVFSSGRAMAQLVEMARDPRPLGSPEHTRVREHIVGRLEGLGLEPEVHTSLSMRRTGESVRAVTLRNILARIPGTASSGAVVLTAHYDAAPLSAGAGDDATGVVAILETVRALQAGPPLENDVIVLITDGEELGLLGARAFVEEHPWMDEVALVFSVEMRGGGGPSHMFETGAENGWIVRAMKAADPRPLAGSLSVEVYRRLPNDTDFTPFRQAGIQGLNFAGIGRPWVYHQPTDIPQNVQETTLQHHGMRVLAITREVGRRDLSVVHAPDLVYTTLPVLGIVAHPVGWALPISGGILLLWLALAIFSVARGGRLAGILAGLGITVVAGGAAWGLGWALIKWLPRFHPEFQGITPAFYGEGWYVLGLTAGGLAVTAAILGLARRRFSLGALGSGALLLPAVLTVGLAATAPLAALTLQGPVLAGLLAVGVTALGEGGDPRARMTPLTRALVLLLALPVLAFLVPLVEGLWLAMSFRMAPALGALVVLTLACLLPALDGLGEPNRWWAPAAAGAVAALLVAVGVLRAGPSPDRPAHSTLLYALDRTSGEAVWATRDDPGVAWAEQQAGPFTREEALAAFLVPDVYRTAPAPTPEIPAPHIESTAAAPGAPPGTVRLAVTSPVGVEIVTVLLPEGHEGGLVAVNGEPLPPAPPGSPGARRPVTRIIHQGVPDGALTMDVEVPEGLEELILEILETHLRAPELLGPEPFRRPPHLIPNPLTRSDRALVRSRVAVPLGDPPEEESPPVQPPSTGSSLTMGVSSPPR